MNKMMKKFSAFFALYCVFAATVCVAAPGTFPQQRGYIKSVPVRGVKVFPANTPIKTLPSGVQVIGDGKIVVAPHNPMIISSTAENQPKTPSVPQMKFVAQKRYVFIPINTYGEPSKFELKEVSTGKVISSGMGVLGSAGENPDWYMEVDISAFKDSQLVFTYDRKLARSPLLRFSDAIPARNYFNDYARPSFHFSTRVGKLVDIGALAFYKGRWFINYMFDGFSIFGVNAPFSGRAVSENMMAWRYLPPMNTKLDSTGKSDQFASSCFVDEKNISGLFNGATGGVVFIRNVEGVGDCLSHSSDMLNFYSSAINPIIKKSGKNPFLFFNEDTKMWTLLRIEDAPPSKKSSAEFGKDLKVEKSLEKSVAKTQDKIQSKNDKNSPVPSKEQGEVVFDGIGDEIAAANSIVAVNVQPQIESSAGNTRVAIYTGSSLRSLERVSYFDADFQSVQLFKMHVTGAPNPPRWVMLGGDGRYFVGDFDGKVFKPDSPTALRLFYGDVNKLTLWQNAPNGRFIVSGKIEPQPFSPRSKEEVVKFLGSMTAPYELSLVQIYGGKFQLRARTADEFNFSMVAPTDAVGLSGSIAFDNNNFMLPDACGNRRVFTGELDLTRCRHTAYEIWRHSIAYTKAQDLFSVSKNKIEQYSFRPQTNSNFDYYSFKMLLDSCGVEFITKAGREVIVISDNLVDNDYEIRLLSIGHMNLMNMIRYNVLLTPVKGYLGSSAEAYERILTGVDACFFK